MNLDQLSDLCCPICFSTFSEGDNIPHMLKCGHTHCKQCLQSLINRGDGKCGECRSLLGTNSIDFLPINYAILRIVDAIKSSDLKYEEFYEVEKNINSMIARLTETQNICKSSAIHMNKKIEDLEKEKTELINTKQNILKKHTALGKCKSLSESLTIIKDTVNKIKQLEEQNQLLTKRLQKEHESGEFQSLLYQPEDFKIIVNAQQKLGTKCFLLNKKLYVKALQKNPVQLSGFEIQYSLLRPFLIRTFMVIEYDRHTALLEFELFQDNNRAKQFCNACLGEQGYSYCGFQFYDHARCGQEGESVVLGRQKAELNKPMVKASSKGGGNRVEHIKTGFVEALRNEKTKGSTQFRIYLETWPSKDSKNCFAKLVRGGSILKAAMRNKINITIAETGHVLDLTSAF